MVRIRNDPGRYLSRDAKLPVADPKANACAGRVRERERSAVEAPIDENFYIDHRKR